MPHGSADQHLAESLKGIRNQTAGGLLLWTRMLHPVTGEKMAFRGSFDDRSHCEDWGTEVYILDDDWLDYLSDDAEDGPSLTRYPEAEDKVFDALIVGRFATPEVMEDLLKLIRLVRMVAK